MERKSHCKYAHPKRQNGRDAVCASVLFLAHKSETDVSTVFVPDHRNIEGWAGLVVFDGGVSVFVFVSFNMVMVLLTRKYFSFFSVFHQF